jgi:hypothetical protein
MTGKRLDIIPSKVTTWKRWRSKHPETLVLSTETGYRRDYTDDPYSDYFRSPFAFMNFRDKSPGLPEKELVLGIEIDGERKAYPLMKLKRSPSPLTDTLNGRTLKIYYDKGSGETYAADKSGREIPTLVTYWFVWYGFYPKTDIY